MMKLPIAMATMILLFSCGQDRPKIDYRAENPDTTSTLDDRIKDTIRILVSELPLKFDSTDVLLSAIALVDLQERGRYSIIKSGSYSDHDIASSYFNNDNLIGNYINIVFQDKSGNERKLTENKIEIRSINFLRDIFRQTKTGYLLYSVSDRDSNGDHELTNSDLEALYISKIDGTDFKKITKELHELYDWRLIKDQNKLYFRTLEDKNKDGLLTNKDKFHYYYLTFSPDTYTLTEYNPTKIFN